MAIKKKSALKPDTKLKKENNKNLELATQTENAENQTEESQTNTIIENNVRKKDYSLYWLFGALAFIVIVFFTFYYIFSSLNKFEYEGLTFTKERFGEIPVFHYYYLYNFEEKQYQYNLYLRNDPRKNTVPITGRAVSEGIEFPIGNTIYVSVAPEGLVGCEYGSVGISNLATFLRDNQLKVKGASPDEKLAKENNVEYATCENHPKDVVILLKGGNETRVVLEKENCYVIEVANCEVLQAIEKFQVESILDAKARRLSLRSN